MAKNNRVEAKLKENGYSKKAIKEIIKWYTE
jgi:hypothetical protein